jgi:hypothetical protein
MSKRGDDYPLAAAIEAQNAGDARLTAAASNDEQARSQYAGIYYCTPDISLCASSEADIRRATAYAADCLPEAFVMLGCRENSLLFEAVRENFPAAKIIFPDSADREFKP